MPSSPSLSAPHPLATTSSSWIRGECVVDGSGDRGRAGSLIRVSAPSVGAVGEVIAFATGAVFVGLPVYHVICTVPTVGTLWPFANPCND